MKSVAFFNNKGGVGKTTLVCNLAAFLAQEKHKKVLIIDADPQCNATQTMFSDAFIDKRYGSKSNFTIYKIVQPLAQGKGYSQELEIDTSKRFGVDVLVGDPRLALTEDTLARDWSSAISGETRGLRTSLFFIELLSRCQKYDYVFFDVGPSLGAINRSVLIACDYFLSPMAVDIFSLRALENISVSLGKWQTQLETGLKLNEDPAELPIKKYDWRLQFLGYVYQQYTAKKTAQGESRPVRAYENIVNKIPSLISEFFVDEDSPIDVEEYSLGAMPTLHSLIPMAQNARAPIFSLGTKDGVVGAHFSKVREVKEIFSSISDRLEENIAALEAHQ